MAYRSIVTGGAGFIGSHVAQSLLDLGHEVVVLDDLSGGFRENVPAQSTFVEGSITDHELVDRLFEKYHFDYVFHLAAYAAEGLSHFIRRFNYTNNVVGSMNLINAAVNHDVKCFVFTSSIAVYGPGQTPMREDMKPDPEDPYGVAKYSVELDLRAAHHMFGLNSIVFRPHNVYGENQNTGDKYRNVIGIFMNQIMQEQPCTVFGDGLQTRAFSYISDVAPIIAQSIDNPKAYNQSFNVGADKAYTVKELAQVVQKHMGKETGVKHLDPRKEVVHAFSDHSKAHDILGYEAKVDLNEGIRRTTEWVKSVGPKRSKDFEGIEVERNLPPSWRSVVKV
ncbi:MAG: NAD-dependent epimerase/dehydratase family protein [Phycisphaeraceae bacterium]